MTRVIPHLKGDYLTRFMDARATVRDLLGDIEESVDYVDYAGVSSDDVMTALDAVMRNLVRSITETPPGSSAYDKARDAHEEEMAA